MILDAPISKYGNVGERVLNAYGTVLYDQRKCDSNRKGLTLNTS